MHLATLDCSILSATINMWLSKFDQIRMQTKRELRSPSLELRTTIIFHLDVDVSGMTSRLRKANMYLHLTRVLLLKLSMIFNGKQKLQTARLL